MTARQQLATRGALLCLLAAAVSPAAAQQRARVDRMEAQRYAELRALAEYVDDGAQFALEQARTAVGENRGPRERALMQALRDFARQAQAFHNRVDQYEFEPWRVDAELNRLRTAARNVNVRMRRVPALRDTFEDWDLVMTDIADMQRVLGGADVDLRRPDPEWDSASGAHHESAWPTYGSDDTLRGQRLADFQRLARELDASSARVYQRANSQRADYSSNGAQLLIDLQHFAGQTAAIRRRTDAGEVRPRDIGPTITHILEDARRVDASMRRARVYTSVWEEWAGTIRILEQMSQLVR